MPFEEGKVVGWVPPARRTSSLLGDGGLARATSNGSSDPGRDWSERATDEYAETYLVLAEALGPMSELQVE